MQETMSTSMIITVVSVIFFALLLVLILVIIDHKARIPGKVRNDLFHITGMRRDHPVWSYLVSAVLLTIIGAIGFQLSASILKHTPLTEQGKSSKLLEKLAERREMEQARHFHNSSTAMALEGEKSVCYFCHGDFPHFEKRMIRTLLNMHTQFVGCMTCHTDAAKIDEELMELKWLNYSGIEVSGPHFGTDYDGDTGFLTPTDDIYSKIVPYLHEDGVEKLLEVRESDPVAVDFVRVQEQLTGQERDLVKKSFHQIVAAKGRFCTKCHTEEDKSYMPFKELGFSERRISELTSLNIIGLVQKYKKFYMPELMGAGEPVGSIESLMGPEVILPIEDEEQDDPRSWWRGGEGSTD